MTRCQPAVTVASDGRIFINFPRWGDDVPFTVGEIRGGKLVGYPDAAINKFDPGRPGETLSSVQSVVVDAARRLWILDTGAPSFSEPVPGAAKLMAAEGVQGRIRRYRPLGRRQHALLLSAVEPAPLFRSDVAPARPVGLRGGGCPGSRGSRREGRVGRPRGG